MKIKFTVNQHWCVKEEGRTAEGLIGLRGGHDISTEFMSVNSGELLNSRCLDSFSATMTKEWHPRPFALRCRAHVHMYTYVIRSLTELRDCRTGL